MTHDWKHLYQKSQEPAAACSEADGPDSLAYSPRVLDHFLNPRNVGRVEHWDGLGCFGDPSCGDSLEMTLRLEGDRIVEIGFLVYGCAGVIATSSMVTELAKGRTLAEAACLTDEEVIHALDGLPEAKQHCSLLGIQALRLAIIDTMVMRQCLQEGLVQSAQEYRAKRQEGRLQYDPNLLLKDDLIE
ncbi:MAG: iron-sulfur cluster assembly scaffold protein [Myxococcales bacterium]|nr:iron-sulfur cluster assembly scaffold protein [Myxococcales bacterium]